MNPTPRTRITPHPAPGDPCPTAPQVDVMDSKIDALAARIEEIDRTTGMRFERQAEMTASLNASMKEISDRLRKMETDNIGLLTTLQQQMAAAFRRIDDSKVELETAKNQRQRDIDRLDEVTKKLAESIPEELKKRLDRIETVIPSLILTNKILTFVAGSLTVAIIAMVWSLITGAATIVKP